MEAALISDLVKILFVFSQFNKMLTVNFVPRSLLCSRTPLLNYRHNWEIVFRCSVYYAGNPHKSFDDSSKINVMINLKVLIKV